jgi:hypothetical protein
MRNNTTHVGDAKMTQLLDRAFGEASTLPEEEQDAFANWIFQRLAAKDVQTKRAHEDPILKLGIHPKIDSVDDASVNHDRYLYDA